MNRPSTNQGPNTSSWPWNWPLGGDVTQWIRTSWIKALTDQTGFININNVRAGDPELEQRIIEDVASYGRQLGRIMEVLDVVIGQLGLGQRTDLTADERHALQDFSDLVRHVQALKGEARRGSPWPSWTGWSTTSERSSGRTHPPTGGWPTASAIPSPMSEVRARTPCTRHRDNAACHCTCATSG
jgi:hypothetical protein